MDKILEFQGKYRWLSNFWPVELRVDGIIYPSVEHAYQAAKTDDQSEKIRIASLNVFAAKNRGKTIQLIDGWETKKEGVMRALLVSKFQPGTPLANQLLATGDAIIEEGNRWGDRVWGISPAGSGNGNNLLGKLLMDIRETLKIRS